MLMRVFFSLVVLVLMTLIAIIHNKILKERFIDPAFIFTVYWMTMISIGVLTIDFEYSYLGLVYLIFLCFIALLISNVVNGVIKSVIPNKAISIFLVNRSRIILLSVIILGNLGTIINVHINGNSISSLFSLSSLFEINNEMAVNRYSGIQKTNAFMQILMIFEYLAPIIGGYHFACVKSKVDNLIVFLSFTPVLFSLFVQNTKIGIISGIFLFISSFIVASIYNGKKVHIRLSTIMKWISTGVVIFCMLIFSMILRVGNLTHTTLFNALNKFIIYAFGHIPAFDYWFSNQGYYSYGFGKNTFVGIFNVLGLATREQGVYTDYIYIGRFYSNIYTAFRGLIMDFGVLGSILAFILLIAIGTISFSMLLKKKGLYINSFLLFNVYFFVFFSFAVSSWTYISYIAAFLFFIIYLMMVRPKFEKIKKK